MNGRPSASTPVTSSGTACTIRVLRRFRRSEVGVGAVSDAISVVSSARLLPKSSMGGGLHFWFLVNKCRSMFFGLRVIRYRRMLRSPQEHPHFLGYPDRSYQQIDRSLEECRVVAFNAMTQEEKHP